MANNAEYTSIFRSRLNALPLDFKCEIGEVPLQKGLRPTTRKEMIISAIKNNHVDCLEIGTGTNRFIVKFDGYAMKMALDREGIADNMQEFAIADMNPINKYGAYAHEVTRGGHILMADYCPAFTSYNEMWAHNSTIRSILSEVSQTFLLGDVGLSQQNYANWGLAPDGTPKMIDYAYLFPASMGLFKCICGNQSMGFTGGSFTTYKCTKCGTEYTDRDLRARISADERIRLFNNVIGIKMRKEYEEHEINPKYIKHNYNPDFPDDYKVSSTIYDLEHGCETLDWGIK